MSATPSEASNEYSRGSQPSRGVAGSRQGDPGGGLGVAVRASILVAALLGALLLAVAEMTALFQVHVAGVSAPIKSVSTGSHHHYALIPIVLLVLWLAFAWWRSASRPALLAIGVLALVVLAIALAGDLPDAHSSGLILRQEHYVQASATPSAGMYMETLGGFALLIACVCGFLLIGPPQRLDRSAQRLSAS